MIKNFLKEEKQKNIRDVCSWKTITFYIKASPLRIEQ